jgi:hypothetical protein
MLGFAGMHNIQACDTRRLRNEIVLHLIQVRG